MNDQDFDFQVPQDPKDPKSQVSPALLAALGVTLALAGGYYFWSSSGSTAPTAEAPAPNPVEAPVAAPAPKVAKATPSDAASAAPAAASPSPAPTVAPIAVSATPVAASAGALIPSSNAQFLTNQAIKIAGREDPFKSAVKPMPTPPAPVSQPPLGPPPSLPEKTAAINPEVPLAPPALVAATVPIKGIFQVQQDAYVVVGHTGGDEILKAGDYLDSPDQVQVVQISPSSHTVTFRQKGKDIVRNVEASP